MRRRPESRGRALHGHYADEGNDDVDEWKGALEARADLADGAVLDALLDAEITMIEVGEGALLVLDAEGDVVGEVGLGEGEQRRHEGRGH